MTIFDLLFLFLALVTIVALVAAAALAAVGHARRAIALLGWLAGGIACYLTVVAAVGALTPQRYARMGEALCSDDWCLAVTSARRTQGSSAATWEVSLRLSSRALRVTQRELGVSVYLVDTAGTHFLPLPATIPLDTALGPGESVIAPRQFTVPSRAQVAGLVVARPRFPGCCIIGDEGSLLHRRTIVRLD
ncbi:MAG TPA: hypothetical protein VG818_13255 [Gemmatimonadaceae bacterium]|nr:hypothetical protein [Gemmatimonadaceae bacterium]